MKLIKRISLLPLILLFVLHVSAATFVASVNSDVYHISSCGQAGKIKSENLITFQSAEAAEASGRHPCSFCRDEISRVRKTSPQPTVSATAPVSSVAKSTESPSSTPAPISATGPPPRNYITNPVTKPASTTPHGNFDFIEISLFLFPVSCFFFVIQLFRNKSMKKTMNELRSNLFKKERELDELYSACTSDISEKNEKNKVLETKCTELESLCSELKSKNEALESQCQELGTLLSDTDHAKTILSLSVDQYKTQRAELVQQLRLTYGKDFLLALSGAPIGTYIDSSCLPHRFVSKGDDQYTLHRSATGKFHTKSCTHFPTCTSVPALDVSKDEFSRNRCLVCNPQYPDLTWYKNYLHFIDLTK